MNISVITTVLRKATLRLALITVGSLANPPALAQDFAARDTLSDCPPSQDRFAKQFDVIVFGDEAPGIMTALKVKRELRQRKQRASVALMTEGDLTAGIGGHLVRGGLAYLDRNQVPPDMWSTLDPFAASSRLYREFIAITGTRVIALDRVRAATALRRALAVERVTVVGNVHLQSVQTADQRVCSLQTAHQGTFIAKYFIDATQSGKLAEMSGATMLPGFAHLGLSESSLSLGLVFEVYGLSTQQLQQIEARLIRRFLNPRDRQAQEWLQIASGNDPSLLARFRQSMTTGAGTPAVMYQSTVDSADVLSYALSIAFHGMNGLAFDLQESQAVLDRANIAVLGNRLSFNALLFYTDAQQAKQLSQNGSQPSKEMLAIAKRVAAFFKSLGAHRVEFMDELYVRYAGQIANPVDELSASQMAQGGVPAEEALGTFSYHLDMRGGVHGLEEKVTGAALPSIRRLLKPTFNYGFRHTLPAERENLAVLGPASGFGGLGASAGRIVEFNISVGGGLAIAVAIAIAENRSLHAISHQEVRQALGYTPKVYGRRTSSWFDVFLLEKRLREQ